MQMFLGKYGKNEALCAKKDMVVSESDHPVICGAMSLESLLIQKKYVPKIIFEKQLFLKQFDPKRQSQPMPGRSNLAMQAREAGHSAWLGGKNVIQNIVL